MRPQEAAAPFVEWDEAVPTKAQFVRVEIVPAQGSRPSGSPGAVSRGIVARACLLHWRVSPEKGDADERVNLH